MTTEKITDIAFSTGYGFASDAKADTITLADGSQHESIKITSVFTSKESFLDVGSGLYKGPSMHLCPESSVRVWYDHKNKKWHMVVVDIEEG